MEIIDLSHSIVEGMQIYPGDPSPSISRFLEHEKDYCHVDQLSLGTHTGTHIDAPYHFIKDGKKINDFPIDHFINSGVLVDVSHKAKNSPIEEKDIQPYQSSIQAGDFLIFRTGWDKFFNTKYYKEHPFISKAVAELIVQWDISLVGVDALNVDPTIEDTFLTHDVLLSHDILIVENLCNLKEINQVRGMYSFLPLKLMDTDGSPIRAVYYNNA